MYEEYIGKTLTRKKIFDTFIDNCAVGIPLGENKPGNIRIIVKFIGSCEEGEKFFEEARGNRMHCCICYGRVSRKGTKVIENSHITMDEIMGEWHAAPVDDGGMSDLLLILLPDGRGLFAEANMGPYWGTDLTWYVEDDIFNIMEPDIYFYRGYMTYNRCVEVTDICGRKYNFSSLERDGKKYKNLSFPVYYKEIPNEPYSVCAAKCYEAYERFREEAIIPREDAEEE